MKYKIIPVNFLTAKGNSIYDIMFDLKQNQIIKKFQLVFNRTSGAPYSLL